MRRIEGITVAILLAGCLAAVSRAEEGAGKTGDFGAEFKRLGGTEVTYKFSQDLKSEAEAAERLTKTLDSLRKNLEGIEAEVVASHETPGRIVVRVLGGDKDRLSTVRRIIEKTGNLELREAVTKEQWEALPAEEKELFSKPMKMKMMKKSADAPDVFTDWYVKPSDKYDIGGMILSRVYATMNDIGQPAVGFEFTAEGAKRFGEMTKAVWEHKTHLGIIFKGVLESAPVVEFGPITGGRGIIEGNFTQQDVANIVTVLDSGRLLKQLVPEQVVFVAPEGKTPPKPDAK